MCSRVFGDAKVWGCPAFNGKSSSEQDKKALPLSSSGPSPTLKNLCLSKLMNPKFISLEILIALNSSKYNGLLCQGLNFLETKDNNNNDEDNNNNNNNNKSSQNPFTGAPSYAEHLKLLIRSRKWMSLEFQKCHGVETLLWMPAEATNRKNGCEGEDCSGNGESTMPTNPEKMPTTTEVESLVLKFPRVSSGFCYDEKRHCDFFANLWHHWKVRKLTISMDFTPKWTREFSRNDVVSALEQLQLHEDCTWHRQPRSTPSEGNEASESAPSADDDGTNNKKNNTGGNSNTNTNNGTTNDNDDDDGDGDDDDTSENMDCWEHFCRKLRYNHPELGSLHVRCLTGDDELAYLIHHAIAPAANASTATHSSILPIEKLHFGAMCRCRKKSLHALSVLLESSLAKRWTSLVMYSGVKGRQILLDQHRPGFLLFCHALQHATSLTELTLGDYVLDETVLGALFGSLTTASGNIEKLWMNSCGMTSPEIYERVLCADRQHQRPQRLPGTRFPSSCCLLQNKLPSLRVLILPKQASRAISKVLKYNTSIESTNGHLRRGNHHEYYLDLNRGGRRILTASSASERGGRGAVLSPSLWPKILERACNCDPVELSKGVPRVHYCGGRKRKYDVVYCLLRNRILLESL